MEYTSIYRPDFSEFTQMTKQVIDRHAQDMSWLRAFFYEHKDADGVVYQLTPHLEIEWKGLVR